MIIVVVTSILLFAYSLLMLYFKIQWDVTEEEQIDKKFQPNTAVTVVVAARNEEKNIQQLLDALGKQDYPKKWLEIIVVDDFSEDDTAQIVQSNKHVRYLHLKEYEGEISNSFKKKALTLAIEKATGDLIITTDADCAMCDFWLKTMVQLYEKGNAYAVAGPVQFWPTPTLLEKFQALDFLTMQGITAAVLNGNMGVMGNGANLLYAKKTFKAVNGFDQIDDRASGDDMMLLHKIEEHYPKKVQYAKIKDAIVTTTAEKTFSAFVQQRIRWASKNKSLNDQKIKWVLLLVLLLNLSLLFAMIQSFWSMPFAIYALVLFSIKCIVEYFFVKDICTFFNQEKLIPYLFLLQPFHILYISFVGILGLFSTYRWKGRRVK